MAKLCKRGREAAERRFDVYPSAYANAYASKICAGKIKDPSGLQRKDFRGPKPRDMNAGGFVAKRARIIDPRGFSGMLASKRPRTRSV